MRIAVIADIHGNVDALEAVLSDIRAQGITEIVNLGDLLSGPLAARRTADTLMPLALPTVRGNHDRWLTELAPGDMGLSDREAFGDVDKRHVEWLSTLPPTLVHRDEILMCHGTPASDTTYWLEAVSAEGVVHTASINAIEAAGAGLAYPLILCGHTHLARIVRLRDGRLVVNPGSVGCPGYTDIEPVRHNVEAGSPDARYAIVERTVSGWQAVLRHVSYDPARMVSLAQQRGRDGWVRALATGWLS